jgi:hypothetical protein
MISDSLATRLMMRFTTLKNRPEHTEAFDEITSALQRYALNDDHAVRIVNKWMDTERYWPTPMDIAETAESLPTHNTKLQREHCTVCNGGGYELVYILHTHERVGEAFYKSKERIPDKATYERLIRQIDGIKQRIYEHAQPCTHCNYGRGLQREFNDRNPNRPAPEPIPDLDESKLHFEPRPEPQPAKPRKPGPFDRSPSSLKPVTEDDIDRVRERLRKEKEKEKEKETIQ